MKPMRSGAGGGTTPIRPVTFRARPVRREDASGQELLRTGDAQRALSDARWFEDGATIGKRAGTEPEGPLEAWTSVQRNTGSAPGEPQALAGSDDATRGKLEPMHSLRFRRQDRCGTRSTRPP